MCYSSSSPQMANAVLIRTSLPSINTKSHTRSTQFIGRHVQNSVRNHCIVKTLVNGGSNDPKIHSKLNKL